MRRLHIVGYSASGKLVYSDATIEAPDDVDYARVGVGILEDPPMPGMLMRYASSSKSVTVTPACRDWLLQSQGVFCCSRNPYHKHLDVCERCRENPFDLCPVGDAALRETAGTGRGFARAPDGAHDCANCGKSERDHVWTCMRCEAALATEEDGLPGVLCHGSATLRCPAQEKASSLASR